jgi:hypothetical protein
LILRRRKKARASFVAEATFYRFGGWLRAAIFGVQRSVCNMAIFLAVGVAILLMIVISIAYALVLRELRKINANLEQFIKLIVDARRREDLETRDFSSNTNPFQPRQ